MVPSWFPAQEATRFTPSIQDRLLYPLNYSTGLAALMTMGVPLLLNATASARTHAAQALAAAALPMAGLGLWLTGSSLALPLVILAVGAYLVLTSDRLPKLATAAVAGIGAAILIAAETQRDALDRGLATATAEHQGHELLAIAIVVCAGVAALQLAISVIDRSWTRPRWLTPSPRTTAIAGGAVIAAVVIAVGAGAPGWVSDEWDDFANSSGSASSSRGGSITDLSSTGRAEFWKSADDAFESKPWTGIGPGTFEFWWSQHGTRSGPVTDAHSLPRETLAELGIPGFVLLMGFCVGVVAIGAVRAFRVSLRMRDNIAAATATSLAFLGAVTVDWSWELGVIPAAFLLVAAVAVAGGGEPDPAVRHRQARGPWRFAPIAGRVAVVGAGVACLIAIALPLAVERDLAQSQDAAAQADLSEALTKAQDAANVEPYAAMPKLQEALVLERQGKLEAALAAATSAEGKESTNWQIPLIISRLEARLGNARAAVDAYRTAYWLAPRLPILAKPEPSS